MGLTIRLFEDRDAAGWAEIYNQDNPDPEPTTAEHIRQAVAADASFPLALRWVGELDGKVVGLARLVLFESEKLWVTLKVHRDYRGRGFGKQLASTVGAHIPPQRPLDLRTFVGDLDYHEYRTWAEGFGFKAYGQSFDSRLTLTNFDATKFNPAVQHMGGQAIQITVLLPPLDDAIGQDLHRLTFTAMRDEPTGENNVPELYPDFQNLFLKSSKLQPVAWFVAALEQKWIGVTGLFIPDSSGLELDTSVTAVLPEYRGRGIAKALKVRSVLFAKEQGFTHIRTSNDTRNASMLAINTALGFVPFGGIWLMKHPLE